MISLTSPLVFDAIPVSRPWAGTLAQDYLHGSAVPGANVDIGEICYIEDSPVRSSTVSDGVFQGMPLSELMLRHARALVGRRHSGASFPLAVRMLDVGQDLSLWVHPPRDDTSDNPGTIKFWYSLAENPEASIAVGLQMRATRDQFLRKLNLPDLHDHLQVFPARAGDAFFILPGRVHGASAGNLLIEIAHCDSAPLCVTRFVVESAPPSAEQERAVRAIRFKDRQVGRISREAARPTHSRRVPLVPHCPEFTIDEVCVVDHVRDRTTGESFHLIFVVHGGIRLSWSNGELPLEQGRLCCIPADLGPYAIEKSGGVAGYLRVTL